MTLLPISFWPGLMLNGPTRYLIRLAPLAASSTETALPAATASTATADGAAASSATSALANTQTTLLPGGSTASYLSTELCE